MARGARSAGLAEDDLVARLAPDPGAPPDVRLVSGWLGKSTRRGYWRLYLTPGLSRYVEVDESAIRHHQRLVSPDSPLGGTLLWIDRDAKLLETRTTSREAQATFLDGDIMAMLRDPQVAPLFDLTAIPGGVPATTILCFTVGVALGGAGMIIVSKWNSTCARLRSYIQNC
jgi:hypothetical protein